MQYSRRKFIRLSSNGIILPLMRPRHLFAQTEGHGEITLTGEALRIHQEALVIDGHNDMPGNILDKALNTRPGFTLNETQSELHTDIPRLRQGGVDAQVFVAYISPDYIHTGGGNQACLTQIELVHNLVIHHLQKMKILKQKNVNF